MKSSIKQRLLTYLMIVTVITAIPAFALSLLFSYQEAKLFQDKTLEQIGDLNVVDAHLHHQASHDKQYQLSIFLLTDPELPTWIPANLALGFHTLDSDEQRMRLWVGEQADARFVVMQPTSERDIIAMDNALRSVLPLLILIPLLSGLIWLVVSKELASMTLLARTIDQSVEPMPQSLPVNLAPTELQGFIIAINHLLNRWHGLFVQQQRFSADAAHELRTPLTALSLQVENLDQAKNMQQVHDRLIPVRNGVNRCQRLATQLLDFNRLQTQAYQRQTVDLQTLLLDLLSLYWPAAEAKQQRLLLDLHDSIKTLNSHREALELILANGLDNAIKYTPSDSEIHLRVQPGSQGVTLCILDQGQGMSDETLASWFDPFVRAHSGRVAGNGLGLSIAKAAAEQLNAKLSLSPRTDQSVGLCFCLVHP